MHLLHHKTSCLFFVLPAVATLTAKNAAIPGDMEWYKSEIQYLANLKPRLTGSPNQDTLINHIQSELERMNLPVYTDTLNFTYDKPTGSPSLVVNGKVINVSATLPYSGNTPANGVTGKLHDLIGHQNPPWSVASGGIAIINATIVEASFARIFPLWPGSPGFPQGPAIPLIETFGPDGAFPSLAEPLNAGVKGIIAVWENITATNSHGQYIFGRLYQGVPMIFVAPHTMKRLVMAAKLEHMATLAIPGETVPETDTRTIWTVIEGSKYKNESVLLNTHTDGLNALEENGHLALLARAYNLTHTPPERTTVIAFVSGHLVPAFSPLLATGRWLSDNPVYWKGGAGQMTAVAASCVEHLGALDFQNGVPKTSHATANTTYVELLLANSPELASLTQKLWHGADSYTRIANPIPIKIQFGEGLAFFAHGIPEVSLATLPPYLLTIFRPDFDESSLIDFHALKRQVDSFGRLWEAFDTLPTSEFGHPPANLTTGF